MEIAGHDHDGSFCFKHHKERQLNGVVGEQARSIGAEIQNNGGQDRRQPNGNRNDPEDEAEDCQDPVPKRHIIIRLARLIIVRIGQLRKIEVWENVGRHRLLVAESVKR